MLTVILAIGREILRGRVQDTNSWTLARRLTGLGHEVVRIAACDDDLVAIVREVRRAAEDGATLVVTTGGLGPTDDDRTLQALADATDCPLALHPEARDLVADFQGGDTQFDEESGEGDTLSMERERDLTLSASARAAIEEIDPNEDRVLCRKVCRSPLTDRFADRPFDRRCVALKHGLQQFRRGCDLRI